MCITTKHPRFLNQTQKSECIVLLDYANSETTDPSLFFFLFYFFSFRCAFVTTALSLSLTFTLSFFVKLCLRYVDSGGMLS